MKKVLSLILCVSLLASIICVPVSAISQNTEETDINDFINGVTRLTQKYDSEKNFEVATEVISSESISEEAPSYFSEASVSENETRDEPELNFQTCRLIVQSDIDFNNYGAVEVVSGFENFHILQFEDEESAKTAYEKYLEDDDIISVDVDSVKQIFDSDFEGRVDTTVYTREDFDNDWSMNATGMDKVLEYYKNYDFPEIVVGVIDTGIDLDHEIFEDRIIRTYFNSSSEPITDDEADVQGHGTMVASTIVRATPENVKVAVYKMSEDGNATESVASVAMLKVVNDGIKIINCSYTIYDDLELQKATLMYAKEKGCFVANAAGNDGVGLSISRANYQNSAGLNYCVGSSNKYHVPSSFTCFGSPVDVLAPGEDICVAMDGNAYGCVSGTSFSSPLIVGIYTMLTCVHPEYTIEEKRRMISGSNIELEEPYIKNCFKCGVINALDLFELNEYVESPKFSLDSGIYEGKVTFEIYAEEGCDIYYTFDQTYPTPTNGTLYTQPIELEGDYFTYTAVAYKNGYRSDYTKEIIHSATIGTDDMFTISDDGTITGYTGDALYLKIPETVNGIEVNDIAECLFSDVKIYGIILPDTMTYLGDVSLWGGPDHKSFIYQNEYIDYLIGENIELLGYEALYNCKSLKEVDFPNLNAIGGSAFNGSRIVGVNFPKVKTLLSYAFYGAMSLREVYLPECTAMLDNAFDDCRALDYLYAPLLDMCTESIEYPGWEFPITGDCMWKTFFHTHYLQEIDLPNIRVIGFSDNIESYNLRCFENSSIKRVNYSKIEYIYDIPIPGIYYSLFYRPVDVDLVLPSTLRYSVPIDPFLEEGVRRYNVYGSRDTYAEEWAETNKVNFIELSPQTAIAEDIETIWDEYSYKPLVFDARGFNRTYQWYGSYDNKVSDDDIAIEGATTNEYNPGDSDRFAYYYCQMTSTDIDNYGNIASSFTVNSTLCQNRFYYMYAKDKTEIDIVNKLIYTTQFTQTSLDNILGLQETTSNYSIPSYVYRGTNFFGTGSQLFVYDNGAISERYTVIVEGDINGDSAVDVLDTSGVEQTLNGHKKLNDNYFLAADANRDDELTIVDYQQVVNFALQS